MQTALKALSESFCKVLLDPQYVDIGVSRVDRDWRIVLARPLLVLAEVLLEPYFSYQYL